MILLPQVLSWHSSGGDVGTYKWNDGDGCWDKSKHRQMRCEMKVIHPDAGGKDLGNMQTPSDIQVAVYTANKSLILVGPETKLPVEVECAQRLPGWEAVVTAGMRGDCQLEARKIVFSLPSDLGAKFYLHLTVPVKKTTIELGATVNGASSAPKKDETTEFEVSGSLEFEGNDIPSKGYCAEYVFNKKEYEVKGHHESNWADCQKKAKSI